MNVKSKRTSKVNLERIYESNPLWNIWKETKMGINELSKTIDMNYTSLRDSLHRIRRPALLIEKLKAIDLISEEQAIELLDKQEAWVAKNGKVSFYNILPSSETNYRPKKEAKKQQDNNASASGGNGKCKAGNHQVIKIANPSKLNIIKSKAYDILSRFYQGERESYSTVVDYTDIDTFHVMHEIEHIENDVEAKIETRIILKKKDSATEN